MFRKLRPRSAYDVVALLALFVALGGTTYAAATIGPNDLRNDAVRTRHIKAGEVKNSDLARNSVGGRKVINNSLTGADVNEGTLGRVPLATNAGHAATAGDAATLQGKALSGWDARRVFATSGPLPREYP